MLTFTRINTQHPHYSFVEELLHLSFPVEERRDDEGQRRNTDENDRFYCYLLTDKGEDKDSAEELIGLITVWKLDGFYYAEHLATSPTVRNRGYGRRIMEELKALLSDAPIILEVERPEDEMSRRRIGFYQRCGFKLCEQDYYQPPYRAGGKRLPLYLMFAGVDEIDSRYPQVRNEIYRNVYGLDV